MGFLYFLNLANFKYKKYLQKNFPLINKEVKTVRCLSDTKVHHVA